MVTSENRVVGKNMVFGETMIFGDTMVCVKNMFLGSDTLASWTHLITTSYINLVQFMASEKITKGRS